MEYFYYHTGREREMDRSERSKANDLGELEVLTHFVCKRREAISDKIYKRTLENELDK